MPYSINGFGTKLYGKRDFQQNASYITTEWFAVAATAQKAGDLGLPLRGSDSRDINRWSSLPTS
jgi:hypothetical protein